MSFRLLVAAVLLSSQALAADPLPSDVKENAIGAGTTFTDARGMTLYTSERDKPGQSLCTGACAKAWPPLAAAPDAAPVGAWTPIAREGGGQWSFKGRPVYTYAKDASPGNAYGDGAGNYAWRILFVPLATPAGFSVRTTALGYVLADAHGLTLYRRDDEKNGKIACTAAACLETWTPFAAPLMASGSPPWGIAVRPDGSHQWAYQGHALYRFAEDVKVRDVRGDGRDNVWHAMVLTPAAARPSWVSIQATDMGPVFADAAGHTLYVGPDDVKLINKLACDEACVAASVHVVPAGKDAKAAGDWSVVMGQAGPIWAYRGSPVYTHAQDRGPGDIRGDKWASSLGAGGWEPIVATIGGDEVP